MKFTKTILLVALMCAPMFAQTGENIKIGQWGSFDATQAFHSAPFKTTDSVPAFCNAGADFYWAPTSHTLSYCSAQNVWSAFTTGGGGGTYVNGTGLGLAGSTFSVLYGTTSTTAAVGNDARFGNATKINGTDISGFNGFAFYTSGTPGVGTYSNIVNLWTTCTSGFLKFDGTCSAAAGSITLNGTTGTTFTLPLMGAGPGIDASYNSGTNTTTISTKMLGRVVSSGTTDNITNADRNTTINYNNTSNTAVAVAQTPLNIVLGSVFVATNTSTGTVTFTPATSTIGGAATYVLGPGTLSAPKTVTFYADATGNFSILQATPSAGGSGPNITQGTYASLPGTCTTKDVYYFTSGEYDHAYCSATNTWQIFLDSYPLTQIPATMTLSANTFNRTTGVTFSTTNGYESLAMTADSTGADNMSLHFWTAPGTPYTKYVFLQPASPSDSQNYRMLETGFEDSTGARLGITCGMGTAVNGNYWCRVISLNSTNTGKVTQVATFFPAFQRHEIVSLADDGTNITIGLCTDPLSCNQIYSAARTSVIGAPVNLYYGAGNTGTTGTRTVAFLGVQ